MIADNVGDNVGDCAGMAADLFETYAVTIVAAMLIASNVFVDAGSTLFAMMLPLMIGALCIVGSVAGTFFVRFTKTTTTVMGALYRGFYRFGNFSALLLLVFVTKQVGIDQGFELKSGGIVTGLDLIICGGAGLGVTGLLVWITEYYTSTDFRPVREIAKSSETGHGTNIIQGLAVSMEATALPVLVICIGIYIAFAFAGLCMALRLQQQPCCQWQEWLLLWIHWPCHG